MGARGLQSAWTNQIARCILEARHTPTEFRWRLPAGSGERQGKSGQPFQIRAEDLIWGSQVI